MLGIVIVAHGGLAREYLATLEHVMGLQAGIRAIGIAPDDDRIAKAREICEAADAVDQGHGVVMVTDLHGGSPCNLARTACIPAGRSIVFGANMPLLIKLAKSRHLPVADALRAAKEAGRKYIDSQSPNDATP